MYDLLDILILIIIIIITAMILYIILRNNKYIIGGGKSKMKVVFGTGKNKIKADGKKHFNNLVHHIKLCGGDVSKISYPTIQYDLIPSTSPTPMLSKMLTNENTIQFFKYQNLDRFKKLYERDTIFKEFMKWAPGKDIIMFSGVVAFALGIRKISDVDVFSRSHIDVPKDVDLTTPSDMNRMIEKAYDIDESYLDDPKKYMYFMGIKCETLDHYLEGRFLRQRPKSIAELRAISELTPLDPKIPPIPKFKLQVHTADGFSYN